MKYVLYVYIVGTVYKTLHTCGVSSTACTVTYLFIMQLLFIVQYLYMILCVHTQDSVLYLLYKGDPKLLSIIINVLLAYHVNVCTYVSIWYAF